MGTYIVIAILVVIVFFSIKSSKQHFEGEGSCCGGGGGDSIKVKKKKLDGDVVAKKIMHIEGMHCEKCKNRVENAINRIDGAVAKVNLKKKIAEINMTKEIADDILSSAVEYEDYKVIEIERVEV